MHMNISHIGDTLNEILKHYLRVNFGIYVLQYERESINCNQELHWML